MQLRVAPQLAAKSNRRRLRGQRRTFLIEIRRSAHFSKYGHFGRNYPVRRKQHTPSVLKWDRTES